METTTNDAPINARYATILFVALGALAIVFAGLFSAVTARSASYHSAWFVAYMVLIVGLAQAALGIGQWWLASKPLRLSTVIVELLLFNIGNAGVVVGTLIAAPFWVYAGSIGILIALTFFASQVRSPRRGGIPLWGYRTLLVVLFVSVLVGVYFAYVASL